MHLSDEQIQRLLHRELDARDKEVLSLHVAECNACARRIADAEREESEVFGLLRHLDHPAPRVDAGAFARGRGTLGVWGRRVAVFVVIAALGGAAYAIPGSPLPSMMKKVAEWVGGDESPAPLDDDSTTAAPVTSGIAVPPAPRFSIDFVVEQDQGAITAWLTDGPDIVVRVLGGAATFTKDVDRLTIDNRGSTAAYEIEIPRATPFVELSIGATRIVLKDGDSFAPGVTADPRGRYLLPLAATHE